MVRTRRVLGALVMTKHSVMARMSPTSSTTVCEPLLASAARAAVRAQPVVSASVTSSSYVALEGGCVGRSAVEVTGHPDDPGFEGVHHVGAHRDGKGVGLDHPFSQFH